MIPKEILKKVRRLEITTRALVNDVFSGEYHSVFKGRGMAFAEVREYTYGDDIRNIDWNVTARAGHPYVKVFDEERELTVMLLVDVSSSGNFGTYAQMKGDIAAEICALLAFSAIKNNDKVGLIIFTDRIEKFVPPKKGRSHVLRVLREILYHRPAGTGTNLATALEYLNRVIRRKAVVFLVSDFLSEGYEKALRVASRRHDLVAIPITDPRETEIPNIGLVELEDAETGEIFLLDTRQEANRKTFAQEAARRGLLREKTLRATRVDPVEVRTDQPYIEPLVRFFRMRAKRFR
ncbi:MAG: DUF58 domain-containing protein [candidate division KSB1 bacterium]|nr:DUF58 domain-containing protein [candidate division KSB1 bacterium]MDZ7274506.1 DUF58 domain-containing protein [candidate division KSB1 bacterium]MDZ7284833.1 DUF58 domain-containing protein [candidate division KSB1 bacterium]MDZ7297747.1 DUF58 domain-containing protein [candidate division KSB1 bacterium]MDZ7307578.1 DUF58 domain-containing protein [candidate division KSB1 bacterium]